MRVILITGAGKGIGRSIALEFARQKSDSFQPKLFLNARTESDLKSLQSELTSLNVQSEYLVSDISNMTDVKSLFDACMRSFGTIDCLVNNAGVGRFNDILKLTEEDYEYTMSTNLKGTFFLTQSVFEFMQSKRSGHIFFITSVAAETPFEQSALYCMSKFGQKGLVDVLRLYAHQCNVRITNVMPGAVYTPMWGEFGNENQARMMRPEDIAKPIVDAFLQPTRTSIEEIVIRPIAGDL